MIKREDIQYRVGQVFKNKKDGSVSGANFLVYIDARTAFRELDEVFPKSWSFDWEYIQGETGVKGKLTVEGRLYADVGYPNESKVTLEGSGKGEWLKDAVSDSVKRCAIQVGIGRELYDAPFLYANDFELNLVNGKVSGYKPLTDMGEKKIVGEIDKWYLKVNPKK